MRLYGLASFMAMLLGIFGQTAKAEVVIIETTLGEIEIQVATQEAPATSQYFLDIISKGLYNEGSVYRSATLDDNPEMQFIQAGMLQSLLTQTGPISANNYDFPVLREIESTEQTGLKHETGTVSFARDLLDTGYVIPDIFICLRDCPWADAYGRDKPDTQGFPAFGKVTRGLDVLEKIATAETQGATTIPFLKGQILSQPIRIESARVISD
jgi:peptidyl-prolyl cis-trans isomerase A (cyclophilin A)